MDFSLKIFTVLLILFCASQDFDVTQAWDKVTMPPIPNRTITDHPIETGNCGRRMNKMARIIGGSVTSRTSQWPWQAAVYLMKSFLCGGTVISPNWVLTAAHCVIGISPTYFQVVLGERSLNIHNQTYFNVKRVIHHPKFSFPSPFNNDIALVELSKPTMFTSLIQPICLPYQDEKVIVGNSCYISGWGHPILKSMIVKTLQQAPIKIIDSKVCSKKNSKIAPITKNMFCAANLNNSTKSSTISACQGDSGGPLVCHNGKGKWELNGLISWGSKHCNTTDAYSVFTKVSTYRAWIEYYIKQQV